MNSQQIHIWNIDRPAGGVVRLAGYLEALVGTSVAMHWGARQYGTRMTTAFLTCRTQTDLRPDDGVYLLTKTGPVEDTTMQLFDLSGKHVAEWSVTDSESDSASESRSRCGTCTACRHNSHSHIRASQQHARPHLTHPTHTKMLARTHTERHTVAYDYLSQWIAWNDCLCHIGSGRSHATTACGPPHPRGAIAATSACCPPRQRVRVCTPSRQGRFCTIWRVRSQCGRCRSLECYW